MQVLSAPVPVSREGDIQETAFSIKASGKALKILTSNLYSNPIRAVLNETGSNALDSHKQAGTPDRAALVHLPNAMHPFYSIRDFGIGMDHQFMMKRYPQAFDSTKDHTNDLIGGFGIGGKLSPLGLSDAYTVICWDGKTRHEYSIFFNENGIPTIALLVKEVDAAPRGVEVKVPIARNLHGQFQTEARNHVYKYYKVKPTIKGGSGWDGFPELEFNMTAKDGLWSFFKDGYQVSTAVMGVYHFPIDADSITKLNDEQRALIEGGIAIHVPLGDMDVSSNRESIYYSDKTNTTLKRILDRAQQDLASHIQTEFDKVSSILEAKRLYFNYFRSGGLANKIGRILGEKPVVMFNGVKVTDCILELTDGTTAHSFISTYARRGEVVRKADYLEDIMLQPSVALFEADGRYGSRVKHHVRTAANGCGNMAIVLVFKDDKAKALFYAKNGLDSTSLFTLTSTLPTPPRITGEREKQVIIFSLDETEALKGNHWRASDANNYWDAEMVENDGAKADEDDEVPAKISDIDDKAPIYLVIDRYQPIGFVKAFQRLAKTIAQLRAIDSKLGTIYGIRKTAVEDAKKAGWVTFAEAAKPLIESYFQTHQGYHKVELSSDFIQFTNRKLEHLIPGLKQAKKRIEEIEAINNEVSEMIVAGNTVGAKVPARIKEDVTEYIKVTLKDLYLQYPLLSKMLSAYQFDKKDIEEYISLVDKAG